MTLRLWRVRFFAAVGIAVSAPSLAHAQALAYDPVITDPPRDSVYPPRIAALALSSAGAQLNGIMYVATGPGPHPTLLLLHGDPGNERNLDIAQAVRRAGINVLFFNYRGSWGSGGAFSFGNVLDDVAAALAFVRTPDASTLYRGDPRRVALVGHSMGGWAALMAGARDNQVTCIGGLDFVNYGASGHKIRTERSADSAAMVEYQRKTRPGAPFRADARALVDEIAHNAERWDLDQYAGSLGARPLLMISAVYPDPQRTLTAALSKYPNARVTSLSWRTDHSFSDRRIELTRTVITWLKDRCGF